MKRCILYYSNYMDRQKRKKTEQGSSGAGWREGEFVCRGFGASVWKDDKVLEIESGDSCAALGMYLMFLSYASESG